MTAEQQSEARRRIDARMAELGMSRAELARRMGSQYPFVCSVLTGGRPLTWNIAIRIAIVLHDDIDIEAGVMWSLFGD